MALVSILCTSKNEEENIARLLDSLLIQEPPVEIIVVDAGSKDRTQEIVRKYANSYPNIKLYVKEGTRGESLNYGIEKANGDIIAFIGADDEADKDWIKHIRKAIMDGNDVVFGKCVLIGKYTFERVKMFVDGVDISMPGTNTAYRKDVLLNVGGFDSKLVTAEDIDLHLRVVKAGYRIHIEENAIVYRYTRASIFKFIKQAFWNGYGRKQLLTKHGDVLTSSHSLGETLKTHLSFLGMLRLISGMLGYFCSSIRGQK